MFLQVSFCTWAERRAIDDAILDDTVDGRNPAPTDLVNIPLITRFYTSQVVGNGISSINSMIGTYGCLVGDLLVPHCNKSDDVKLLGGSSQDLDTWLIDANNHGDRFRPLRIGVFSFQMA